MRPHGLLDRIPDGLQIDSVSVDDHGAAKLGVSHLIERGHRRIAMITGSLALRNERERVMGWRKAMSSARLDAPAELIWETSFKIDEVAALCAERLAAC